MTAAERRNEARRLIENAWTLLTDEPERFAALYLDHALTELRELDRKPNPAAADN
jgi:hypothetical protein